MKTDISSLLIFILIFASVIGGIIWMVNTFSRREENSVLPQDNNNTGNDVTITSDFEESEPLEEPTQDIQNTEQKPETQRVHVNMDDLMGK